MDLSRMKKHTGVLNNTGVRCIVVFRKLPDDPGNCLTVETERLPDMYHDKLIEIVNSKEAQESNDFYEVLNRRTFPDGLNALQALHYKGFLRKQSIDLVTLYPFPGQALPLALANAQADGTMNEYQAQKNEEAQAEANAPIDPAAPIDLDNASSIAQGLLVQAELLEMEATSKREEAYALAPSLRPAVVEPVVEAAPEAKTTKSRGRPKLSEAEKAQRAEERKVKRRERDRAKAKEVREAKKAAELKAKVDDKIVRDAERTS